METNPHDLRRQIRFYGWVGVALCVFTMTTLLVGLIDIGGPGLTWEDIALGLSIATAKASLVALIFMHLNHERGLIYKILLFTACFAIGLGFLTGFAQYDPIPPHVHMVQKVGEPLGKANREREFRKPPVPAEMQ